MSTYQVTMSRVGRTRGLRPFTVEADYLDDLAEGIRGHVLRYLMSANVDVAVSDDGHVQVFAGFNIGGEGRWVEVAE